METADLLISYSIRFIIFWLLQFSVYIRIKSICQKYAGCPNCKTNKYLYHQLAILLGFDLILLFIVELFNYPKNNKTEANYVRASKDVIYTKWFYIWYYFGIALYLTIFIWLLVKFIPSGSLINLITALLSLFFPIFLMMSVICRVGDRKLYSSKKEERMFIGFLSLRKFNDILKKQEVRKDPNSFYILIEIFVIFIFAIICFGLYYFSLFNFNNAYFHDSTNVCINQRGWFDFIYFSFVTSSTVGYGDIVPFGFFTKAIVIVQIILSWVTISVSIASAISLRRD